MVNWRLCPNVIVQHTSLKWLADDYVIFLPRQGSICNVCIGRCDGANQSNRYFSAALKMARRQGAMDGVVVLNGRRCSVTDSVVSRLKLNENIYEIYSICVLEISRANPDDSRQTATVWHLRYTREKEGACILPGGPYSIGNLSAPKILSTEGEHRYRDGSDDSEPIYNRNTRNW